MITNVTLPRFRIGDPIKADDLNKLAACVEKLSRLRVSSPLLLTHDSTGIHLAYVGDIAGWDYAVLKEKLEYDKTAEAYTYKKDPDDTDPENPKQIVVDHDSDTTTIWASPFWADGDYLEIDTKIEIQYNPKYGRWYVVNANCGAGGNG